MTECRECKFWTPIEGSDDVGDCFGHKVPGNMNVDKCPTHSFTPRS
ncbi:MAG: hypothetical protein ACFE8U_08485 [Candidatus Hermodarchaeota archaeon]|jgi:hypothetical protein